MGGCSVRQCGSCVTDCDWGLIGRDCDLRWCGCGGSFGWRTYHRASLHGRGALIRCMLTSDPSPVGRNVSLCLHWGWIHCFGFLLRKTNSDILVWPPTSTLTKCTCCLQMGSGLFTVTRRIFIHDLISGNFMKTPKVYMLDKVFFMATEVHFSADGELICYFLVVILQYVWGKCGFSQYPHLFYAFASPALCDFVASLLDC